MKDTLFNKINSDAVLITSPENITYFSGFSGEGYILFLKDKSFLFTDSRYIDYAYSLNDYIIEDITINDFWDKLRTICENENVKSIAFENNNILYSQYSKLTSLNMTYFKLNDLINDMRIVKNKAELDNIKKAALIADKCFSSIINEIKPGITEKHIAARLNYLMMDFGGDGASFNTIVASGTNSSIPHAVPSDRIISTNEFITLDFGVKYNGYCSDMTRTVYIGNISSDEKKIYDVVLKAHNKVINEAKTDMTGKQIDDIARDYITSSGYGEYFGHGTGHGAGLLVHEKPYISQKYDASVPVGSVFSVEPGIYITGKYGVRIEDLVTMTKSGIKLLSESNSNLIII